MMDLQKYLHGGFNLKRFAVVAIWPQNKKEAVILFRERGVPPGRRPWSIQWRGNGHYFQMIGEALEYCDKRKFRQEMPL